MAKGKKICPKCNKDTWLKSTMCECGHIFSLLNKEKKSIIDKEKADIAIKKIVDKVPVKKEDSSLTAKQKNIESFNRLKPDIQALYLMPPYSPPPKISKDEHADRIIAMGKFKATIMFDHAKKNHCWGHVNWNRVAKAIGEEEDFKEKEIEE